MKLLSVENQAAAAIKTTIYHRCLLERTVCRLGIGAGADELWVVVGDAAMVLWVLGLLFSFPRLPTELRNYRDI